MRMQHQLPNHKAGVALEARAARRCWQFDRAFLIDRQLRSLLPRRRRSLRPCGGFGSGRLLHAARLAVWLDIRPRRTALEPPDLVALRCNRSAQTGNLLQQCSRAAACRAIVDARLSRIDFLRYGDQIWNLLCIDNTNRLRHSDYIAMFRAAGFEIVFEHVFIDPTSQDALSKVPLAARFQGMAPDDIATTWSNIIARRCRSGLDRSARPSKSAIRAAKHGRRTR
jgi:hypothetical protein